MPRCPNCGQDTARTEDWACQWCGYPLLSGSYKMIPKTYQQLKEERLYGPALPVTEPPPAQPEPEATLESKPETMAEPEVEPVPEPEAKPVPQPAVERMLEREPEPVPEPEPEPVLKPKPEPATPPVEVTVEEMLAAYKEDAAAADARFMNKILKVTGLVNRIEVKDFFDFDYITLTSAARSPQNVRCFFDKKHGEELSQLITGQRVTVRGKYDGSMINLRLRDCALAG
jgi:hypothetical protein